MTSVAAVDATAAVELRSSDMMAEYWKNASARDFPRKCRERLQELQQGKDGKLQPFAPMLIWALTKRMRR
ncbi:hypothetical protein BIFBIF_00270 [Bifidobacterium bifidum ATCC 29521 = JCM 1255 = DSM 20456]|nr:hypothetical protein BIFBIF_00270 [Bifidobacterium bifidum ATCC 29521 = JCM 1255 = DSM 20456]